jgi:hypothetical protein
VRISSVMTARWFLLGSLAVALVACGGNGDARPTDSVDGGPAADAGAAPDTGSCSPGCKSTETCCDGRCVDTSTNVDHCGECGNRCEAQRSSSTCAAGDCVIQECEQGFVDCNQNYADGCEATDRGLPGTPRPLAPANGEHTGSAHASAPATPEPRWIEPQTRGSCGTLKYDVQIDDSCEVGNMAACAFPSPEAHGRAIAETSWRPKKPLPVATEVPVGTVYFWRVRACDAGDRCSDWSAPRYLNVGRLRDDLNGDGYSDVIALSYEGGASDPRTFFVPGGADSFGAVQPVSFISRVDYYPDARFLGDVNGDGFMDALRVDAMGAALVLGGRDAAAMSIVPMPETAAASLHAAAALGDYNADGFADFAVSHYLPLGGTGEASSVTRIYLGSATANLSTPLEVLPPTGTTPLEFGLDLEGGVDMNGDGYTDLVIMDGDDGRLHIAYGGAAASTRIRASLELPGKCVRYTAPERVASHALSRGGDVNGDDFGDLAARCQNEAFVYLGGHTPALQAAWNFKFAMAGEARSLAGGYDLGGDGFADLILHGEGTTPTNLVLLPGSADITPSTVPIPFGGRFEGTTPSRGRAITVGDHDGDGRADVLMHDFSGALRWFAGGRTETAAEACDQPQGSFAQASNWCEAATRTVEGTYATATNSGTRVGVSFGFVLAR